MDIEIKLGDKVIRKDGLVGKVVEVLDNGVTIIWDNGLIGLDLPPTIGTIPYRQDCFR